MSPLIDELIKALRVLPGIGPKSAQRCALYLLERQREGGLRLAKALEQAMREVKHCSHCHNLTEQALCSICRDTTRDASLLCVVGTPLDVIAVENSGSYRGYYFVLQGHLSPLDGLGPDEIGIPLLLERLRTGQVRELILATHSTLEGEMTAHYLVDAVSGKGVNVSRLAQGVPMGGELEFLDSRTLAHALQSRTFVPPSAV
ncbi:MAG: recombination protein RecR [Pseudomonadales bacterium]|nr:recombination protein RecR [Pseudomonadales bacterium]